MAQVKWGIDLSSEHERYLAERVFKSPVIVYNYPKEIKVLHPSFMLLLTAGLWSMWKAGTHWQQAID